ncbi:MAG: fibronectin type III domain-containing protein [Brevinema sp.]
MKILIKKHYILFLIMIGLTTACQTTKLTDQQLNAFIISASQGEYSDIVNIKWTKTSYYSHYDLLRSDTEDGEYSLIERNMVEANFNDQGIVPGKNYYYKARGYNQLGVPMYLSESALGYAGASSGFYPPDKVTVASGASTKYIELSWNRVPDAFEYEVLRSIDNDYFEPVVRTPLLHYKDTDVVAGTIYYYQLTAYNKDDIPSPNRSPVVQGSVFGADIKLTTEPGAYADKIIISWEEYSLATKYTVYRSENNANSLGEPITEISTGSPMCYEDRDVRAGSLYYYTVFYRNDNISVKSDQLRSYTRVEGTPSKPSNFKVAQGEDPKNIRLTWDSVPGASSYEIARAISQIGPWKIVGTTTESLYEDKNIPDDSYTYFYTVTGLNPIPGARSDIQEGWANKPPVNISASESFGSKVQISWDSVPNAVSYIVKFSETKSGPYQSAGSVGRSDGNRVIFDHLYSIGNDQVRDLYYTVEVVTTTSQSLPSGSVKGKIQKISAPTNLRIQGNKTPTKSMILAWNHVPGARRYKIYQATLRHRNTDPSTIQAEHFTYLGESQNAAFNLSFTYPIRRHKYMVKAVDGGDAEGVGAISETVWRLPVDATDFAKDVDITIIQAQTQIPNFGYMNSGGKVQGRADGSYDYYAGLSGSKNIWNNYSSYEVILDGAQAVKTDVGNFSATLSGLLTVKGLYNGTIYYNNLNSKQGGFAFAGSLTISYNGQSVEWDYIKVAAEMEAVRLFGGSEPAPRPPNDYVDEGSGSNY